MRSGKQKSEREREKKGERGPGEQKKAWIEKAIARRRRQEQRGEEREAILRSEGARSSHALREEEWLKMQPMAQPVEPKRYRRVRVRKVMKKDPNLAEDREIQQLHARQASRAERLANLRKMQKERQEKMQPRTPSPSTLDTEAAQRETERQREEAVVCGRRVLTYEEWEKRREREKGERGPGEEKKGLNRKRNRTSAASGTAG